MQYKNGKIIVTDFKSLEERGYTIKRHIDEYTRFIGVEGLGISVGFSGWNDDVLLWVDTQSSLIEVTINSQEELDNALHFMDALYKFSGGIK